MRRTFKVILDCDDVLFECNAMALEWLNKEKGTSYTIEDLPRWGHYGDERDERLKYFSNHDFVAAQPPIKGAKEFVHKLSQMAEIFICTSVDPACVGVRFMSILENFPEIKPENILFGRRKDLLNADMILDDGLHNLEAASARFPVLFQRPWNRNNSGVLSVTGYDEFLELVKTVIEPTRDADDHDCLVLIGPSGSGKTQIANMLEQTQEFERIKTYTTKKTQKPYYHVVTGTEFQSLTDRHAFLETSSYQGSRYATRKGDIDAVLRKGKTPVLVLDINGAFALQKAFKVKKVYVNTPERDCIRSILSEGYPLEEQVERIAWMHDERQNEAFCDVSVTKENAMQLLLM